MTKCVVYFPPKRKLHELDYTHERILLSGSTGAWKDQFVSDLSDCEVEIFDPLDNTHWEIEHSYIATLIPTYFNDEEDIKALTILGKHGSTGKVIVCCTNSFPMYDHVKSVCDYDGILLVHTLEDLIDTTLARLNKPRKYRKLLDTSD